MPASYDALDDSLTVLESEGAGDTDGNVRDNDLPSGSALDVALVDGSAGNVGIWVPGTHGGRFRINADGTYDFDANGEFEALASGESATTSVTYGITFTGAASVVDVFLLEDLSGSFYDDIGNVRAQFSGLYDSLNADRDVQFGAASFVDKPIAPFGSSATGDYVYQTDAAVTGDKATVQSALDGMVVRYGADYPESSLEGLYQLALRAETAEVGFRDGAQRIVVLSTDAPYHVAGDFSSAGPNNGDTVLDGSPAGTGEDYPSIAQLKAALEAADVTPVFSVTADVVGVYQDLVAQLGRGAVVVLSSDSSNLTDAIEEALESITTTDTATLTVKVDGEDEGFTFVKDIDVDVAFDFDPSVNVEVDKHTDIDVAINVDPDIEGNTAEVVFDVEAVGKDTYTELDLAVLTVENELSSISGYAVSTVG